MRPRLVVVWAGVLLIAIVALVGAWTIPDAPPPGPLTGLYGSGVAMDAKNNHQVGWTVDQRVDHRFVASTSAALAGIAILQRGGPGYSGGDGGELQVSVEADVEGRPSGTPLASLTFSPGNPAEAWERTDRYTFPSPATLTAGERYHVVFTNVGPAPTVDYISVNEGHTFVISSPRQPAFGDDVAVLVDQGEGWAVVPTDTPIMDLTYADGTHDGSAYIAAIVDQYGLISGTSMARERFTVSGPSRGATTAAVRVKRIEGTSPLVLRVVAADGSEVVSGTVPATSVPSSSLPARDPADTSRWLDASLAGGTWVTITFDPIVLVAGARYDLRLSTAADTTYAVVPLREQSTESSPTWGSRAFRDGSGQKTTNGSDWSDLYAYAPVDLQFYFR